MWFLSFVDRKGSAPAMGENISHYKVTAGTFGLVKIRLPGRLGLQPQPRANAANGGRRAEARGHILRRGDNALGKTYRDSVPVVPIHGLFEESGCSAPSVAAGARNLSIFINYQTDSKRRSLRKTSWIVRCPAV